MRSCLYFFEEVFDPVVGLDLRVQLLFAPPLALVKQLLRSHYLLPSCLRFNIHCDIRRREAFGSLSLLRMANDSYTTDCNRILVLDFQFVESRNYTSHAVV